MTKKVSYGQSVKDVCLYVYGSINHLAKLMSDNGYTASLPPIIGETIIYDESIGNISIKNMYAKKNIVPSTNKMRVEGIGTMIIENTFIIS